MAAAFLSCSGSEPRPRQCEEGLAIAAAGGSNRSWPASSSSDVLDFHGRPVARPRSTQPCGTLTSELAPVTHNGDGSAHSSATMPGPARRRLSGKRSADVSPGRVAPTAASCAPRDAQSGTMVDLPVLSRPAEEDDLQFASFSRPVHKKAWDCMRSLWATECLLAQPIPECEKAQPGAWRDRRDAARESFQQLDDEAKSALARRTADMLREKAGDGEVIRCLEQKSVSMEQRVFLDDRMTVLLTFAGGWKEAADIPVQETPAGGSEAVDAMAALLRTHSGVLGLWQRFLVRVGEHSASMRTRRWSAAFELCPRTFAAGSIRVHAHLFLEASGKLRVKSPTTLAFEGCAPHIGTPSCVSCLSARGRGLRSAAAAGHYYCRIPKVGSIFTAGTNEPFVDYPIKAEWITAYWQAEKLTDARAIEQYILCKRDVCRHIANVREQQRLRREVLVEADATTVQARLRLAKKPRLYVPRVEEEFMGQFRDASLARRRFLVLEGPSCVGKTEYARGLVPEAAQVLELNCANQREHLDLRDLVPGVHRMVLFDEADPELVLSNKKLVQGQACMIQLGVSATSRFSYSVFPWGIMMVVCSNTWSLRLRQLNCEDSHWLQTNSIHIFVDRPLWVSDAVDWEGSRAMGHR